MLELQLTQVHLAFLTAGVAGVPGAAASQHTCDLLSEKTLDLAAIKMIDLIRRDHSPYVNNFQLSVLPGGQPGIKWFKPQPLIIHSWLARPVPIMNCLLAEAI